MSTTLTVRADDQLRLELDRKAKARGVSVSQLVREILREALVEKPLGTLVGHLEGSLELADPKDSWQQAIQDRNWRP